MGSEFFLSSNHRRCFKGRFPIFNTDILVPGIKNQCQKILNFIKWHQQRIFLVKNIFLKTMSRGNKCRRAKEVFAKLWFLTLKLESINYNQ
jgi:hypothetical protein